MEFLPFPKMPCLGASDAPTWVALEKIHGAQLVIGVDAGGVRFGKRKEWLRHEDPFFGWQLLRASLRDAARAAFAAVGAERLVLYGELFGGGYPHPDVPAGGMTPVQTGVWYAPDLRWAPFELRAIGGGEDAFLSWSEAAAVAAAAGLMTPPLLARGRKAEIAALSERFPSRVASALGLPPLGPENLAEGLVAKPDVRMPAAAYMALKRKIAEMREDRFDESAPWDPERPVDLPALIGWGERLANGPRVASAASKVGRHDRAAVIEEAALDVLVDLDAAFPGAMRGLSPEEGEALERAIRAAVARQPLE
ncbi:RNA ligase family protein [Sorangium sp. So ce1389]|uniref:RNA ligase family protein n=1 Tax=Sorangium sp. So ce1389 TaxID=3133336 RepID=UPI003F61E796